MEELSLVPARGIRGPLDMVHKDVLFAGTVLLRALLGILLCNHGRAASQPSLDAALLAQHRGLK